MFTGLVEEVATVNRIDRMADSARIVLDALEVPKDLKLGDSVAVNGVCLTVTEFNSRGFSADAVPETMRRTSLGGLSAGSKVNLERALRVGDRLGGHIVSGHVDGIGTLRARQPEGIAQVLTIQSSPDLMRYIAEKGSICVDGVSLTVMGVTQTGFQVSIIPHTSAHTTLTEAKVGATLNLECDVLAKYVERLLGKGSSGMDLSFLQAHGFA